jgi:hypothetical protein
MNDRDLATRNRAPTDEEPVRELKTRNPEVEGKHRFLLVIVAGVLVAAALAAFGLEHAPNYSLSFFGSSGAGTLRLKAQIATGLLGLGIFQLFLALWIWGRLPGMGTAGRPVGCVHRATGIVLFLVTLPVAAHCMFAYGVEMDSPRAAAHSLVGCFFYGAFVAKILVVRSRKLPDWALPIAGGLLVTALCVLWYSSALWYFNGFRLPLG